jgi:predicted lipid-binding transport protein (Tim44 family)
MASMRRLRIATIVLSCAFLALAPSLAEAAAGNSRSMGSRGSQTYRSAPGTQPLERSITPRPAPSQPQYVPRPAPVTPMGGGFFSQHPFMTGLMGGFIGAGLAGMLFGHSAYAGDASPMGSMLGLLLQLALIGGLVYLGYRLFRRRLDPSASGVGQATYYAAEPIGAGMAAGAGRAVAGPPVTVTDADYAAFGDLLLGIQGAWSRGDLAELKRYATPEMLSYFSEELSRNASQGLENRVENVKLLKGDLLEAWQEDGFEYATAQMRWNAFDYMVRNDRSARDADYVASGTPAQAVDHTEVWTFARSRGGHWLLSAIQQTN